MAPRFVSSRFEVVKLRQNDVGAVCVLQKQLLQFPSAGFCSCTTRFTNSTFDAEQTTSVFGARGERCGGRAARWAATSVGQCATRFISSVCCGVADVAANARRRRLAQQSPPVQLRRHGQRMQPVPLMLVLHVQALLPPLARASGGDAAAACGVWQRRQPRCSRT